MQNMRQAAPPQETLGRSAHTRTLHPSDRQVSILHISLFQRVYKNRCNQCMLKEVLYTNPFPYRCVLATHPCARSVQLCICHEHAQVEAAGRRAKNQKPEKRLLSHAAWVADICHDPDAQVNEEKAKKQLCRSSCRKRARTRSTWKVEITDQ